MHLSCFALCKKNYFLEGWPFFTPVATAVSFFAPFQTCGFQALPDPKDFGLRKGCGLLEHLVNKIRLQPQTLEMDILSHRSLQPVHRNKFWTCMLCLGCFAMLLGMCWLWRCKPADRTLRSFSLFAVFSHKLKFSFNHTVLTLVVATNGTKQVINFVSLNSRIQCYTQKISKRYNDK